MAHNNDTRPLSTQAQSGNYRVKEQADRKRGRRRSRESDGGKPGHGEKVLKEGITLPRGADGEGEGRSKFMTECIFAPLS